MQEGLKAGSIENADLSDFVKPEAPFEPMRMINVNRAFSKLVGRLPQHLAQFPSMMSVQEKRLLFGLGSTYFHGDGIIIDAGIFLGASTRCFGEGVKNNPKWTQKLLRRGKPRRPVVSFERGIVNPGMPSFFKRNGIEINLEPGDSFEPLLREAIEPVADLVDLRIGNILETMKTVKDPVEILFLDVLKSPEISKAALTHFFPLLIPGRSIVVQQDYFYERLEFIKTDQEFFEDHFTFLGEVGSSAVFLCKNEIDRIAVAALNSPLAPSEQERLASLAMQRSIDPSRRFLMAISKVRLLLKLYGREVAIEYLDVVRKDYPEQTVGNKLPRLAEALSTVEKLLKESKNNKSRTQASQP